MALTIEQKAAITTASQNAFAAYNKRVVRVLYNQHNVDLVDREMRKSLKGAQMASEPLWLMAITELDGAGALEVPPTEAEVKAQKEQAEKDRIMRLNDRSKWAGSHEVGEGAFGETPFMAQIRLNKEKGERDAKAAADRKAYNEAHDSSLGQSQGVALQEARNALLSEALTRNHVRVWVKETPTPVYLKIRKLDPDLANRIDSAIRHDFDPGPRPVKAEKQ
jgi:hypothetical protein